MKSPAAGRKRTTVDEGEVCPRIRSPRPVGGGPPGEGVTITVLPFGPARAFRPCRPEDRMSDEDRIARVALTLCVADGQAPEADITIGSEVA